MMRLFIAEKPSVAKAIAGVLGFTQRGEGYLECGADKITWCFGHMLEQAEPDDYLPDDVPRNKNGKKIWRTDELPIIPEKWLLQPKQAAKKQLTVIGKLIREASELVNAGDPDREGQLLVDEVLHHFNAKQPTRRFWVSAQDTVTVKRGLDALQENQTYHGWAEAARGRTRADWLMGMNLSRAYTLRAQRGGSRALLTVGRVQTPTLALVVERDRHIEAFKSVPYHTLRADIQHDDGNFTAAWKAQEEQAGLDSEGRLVDTVVADGLVSKIQGKSGTIADYQQKAKQQHPPLTFSLADITVLASSRYGYSAEEVLKTCQSLYETHKLTSYPRTDCAYLPKSQHADAPQVLAAIKQVNPELANLVDLADPQRQSPTWNDSKITAHHGIVPTMHTGNKAHLNEPERDLYECIVRAYLAQFYPLHEYQQINVRVAVAGETFTTSGKVVTQQGWRGVVKPVEEENGQQTVNNPNQRLPIMQTGDPITCQKASRQDAKTKPPQRFTEGLLIRAMENIHRVVSSTEHKKLLREGDGIGTSSTRAAILSELKRRGFMETKGKQMISTTLGRSIIDALPEVVRSPVLTALNERMLKEIEQGTADLTLFMAKQEAFIRDQVAKANTGAVTIAGGKDATPVSALHPCRACGAGLIRRPSKQKRQFWWGCSSYPTCKQTYPDLKGKPDHSKGRGVSKNATTNKA